MKLYIKNMACESCKIFVKTTLEELDIPVKKVELGEAEVTEDISDDEKVTLNKHLKKAGLELLESKQGVIIEKIKQEIKDHIYNNEDKSPIKFSLLLSQRLGFSYSYLSNLFSDVEATTIEQYVIAMKVERIKELIVLEEHTFSEIAYMLHYSSVAHLSNQFKKVTGLTPSHFKNLKKRRRSTIQEL